MTGPAVLHYLELGSLTELRPPRRTAEDLQLIEQHDDDVVRATTLGIGAPYGWPSQSWDDRGWRDYLHRDDLRHWTAHRNGEVAGLASLRFGASEAEIDTFGLLPAFVGRGLGGTFLAAVVATAFAEHAAARRVWLHTSSDDHPHALRNYQARGFRLYDHTGR